MFVGTMEDFKKLSEKKMIQDIILRRQIMLQYTIQKRFYADMSSERAVEWNKEFIGSNSPHFPYFSRVMISVDKNDIKYRIEPNFRFFSFNGCVYDMMIFAL